MRLIVIGMTILGFTANLAMAQDESRILTRIAEHRYPLSFDGQAIGGRGGEWLLKEAKQAQFVLVGEAHNRTEVERFSAVLFAYPFFKDFRFLAIENGRVSTHMLHEFAKASDGQARITAHFQKYFYSWPFYDRQPGFDLLRGFIQADPENRELWGLDQEFIYASRHLLTRMAELAKKPKHKKRLQELTQQAHKYFMEGLGVYLKTGEIPDGFEFMAKATPKMWQELNTMVEAEANQALRITFFELKKSHTIYFTSKQSHAERVQFFKTNFNREFRKLEQRLGQSPKGFIKMGNMHTSRGYTPLNVLDIGNFAAEMAASLDATSFHINLLSRRYVADGGKDLIDYDPAYKHLLGDSPRDQAIVIDLKSVRRHMGKTSRAFLGTKISDMIFGHDALVVLPAFNEAAFIVPPPQ